MKYFFCFFIAIAVSSPLQGQNCNPGNAYIELDINEVEAGLRVAGDLWWDSSQARYVVPKVEPGFAEVSAIFAGGLWMGGIDMAGNLKLAYSQYRNSEESDYFPGPLDDQGQTTNDACANWDRFFKVNKVDVDAHKADFEDNGVIDDPLSAVYEWPGKDSGQFEAAAGFSLPSGQVLAPFVDLDGDNIYEPDQGEYPDIKGDQAVWWVFNDAGNVHSASFSDPLQVEVHVMAYALQSEVLSIDRSTFYEYEIINKSPESIIDFRLGLWVDPDLGCHEDDYLGYDASRSITYVYNTDAVDGNNGSNCTGGVNTYGTEIPMVGFSMIGSSFDRSESGLMYLNNSSFSAPPATYDPNTAAEAYNLLNNRWLDGTPLTAGGGGYNPGSDEVVSHVYPGEPDDTDGWSMCTEDVSGRDIRFVMTNKLPDFQPGQSLSCTYLVLTTESVELPCPSLEVLRTSFDEVKGEFDNITSTQAIDETEHSFRIAPNPTYGEFVFLLSKPMSGQVIVSDILGARIEYRTIDATSSIVPLSIEDQPEGVYFVTVQDTETGAIATTKLLLQK